MTDGILLAELQRDRQLRRYDTLIIDEAHERSLNIDFILGYLRRLLPRAARPQGDRHVGDDRHRRASPAISPTATRADRRGDRADVPGRAALPAVRRRRRDDDRDQVQAICDAVEELGREGPGDVLVFLSGEREIHDTADALRTRRSSPAPRCCRCTPGCPPPSSTASSSRTAGGASCSARTSPRRRSPCPACATWSTPASPASPATAGASRSSGCRSSRSRRPRPTSAPGAAAASRPASASASIAEEDFIARPEFTEPEILRTNLASVILQMTAIGLGDVAAFPFVEPPDTAAVRDGYLLLEELGAITDGLPRRADRRWVDGWHDSRSIPASGG